MLIPYKIKVAAAVVVLAAGAAGLVATGWQVRDWQADAADLARLESEAKATKRLNDLVDRVNASTSEAIAGIRIENRTIHQKAIHEVQTNTIYADCRLPESGRLLVNDARAKANAAGGTLPAAAPAK